MQAYVNLRGYYKLEAKNRAEGWNVYVTFGLLTSSSPAPSLRRSAARRPHTAQALLADGIDP